MTRTEILLDVEPGGLAANYDPRRLRSLENVGPYADFDLDAFFLGRFAEPGHLMAERVLMFRGARPAKPTSEDPDPPRGRSRQAAAARPDRKKERSERPRSTSTSRAASVTPTVDRAAVIPGMPPKVLSIGTGFNCAVVIRINGLKFRMTLDSGAARSIIRSSFADQLRKTRETRGALRTPTVQSHGQHRGHYPRAYL